MSSIWKRLSAAVIISFFAASGLFLSVGAAHASGETYAWTDTIDTSITASGGIYSAPVSLGRGADDAQGVSFSGTGNITCGANQAQTTVLLHIKPTDYKKADPTPVSSLTLVSSCTTASYDAKPVVTSSASASGSTAASTNSDTCDRGSFSWIACPFINSVSKFISDTGVGIITPFLHVNVLNESNTPQLHQVWSAVAKVADVIFVLVFLLIIFSTVIGSGLDQYTIKRTLPRVIAAAILVQLSFQISGIIIDFGNIMGAGVQQLIAGLTAGSSNPNQIGAGIFVDLSSVIGLIVAGTAIWASLPLVLPTLGILLLSVLAIMFTLAARYIIIALLVILSPLAFVAWVLPNTERYFKQWYTMFIRLILMYPIIIGLLSLGGRMSEILGGSDGLTTNAGTSFLVDIINPFIIVVTFLLIPRTFKWAGGLMHTANNTFHNYAKRGQKRIRESDSYKTRKEKTEARRIDRMRKFSERSAIKSLTNNSTRGIGAGARAVGAGLLSARALSVGGGPASTKAIEKRYGKSFRGFDKELDELNEIPTNMFNEALTAHYGPKDQRAAARAKVLASAPVLMDYMATATGRAAVMARANAKNQVNDTHLRMIGDSNPVELQRMLRTAGKNNFKERIQLFGNDFETISEDGRPVRGRISDLLAGDTFKGMARGWRGKTIADDIDTSVFVAASGAERLDPFGKAEVNSNGKKILYADNRSKSFATGIAENASPAAFAEVFTPGTRNFADKGKRIQILQMLANNKAEFDATDNGKAIRKSILDKLKEDGNKELYDDVLANLDVDPAISAYWTNKIKRSEIKNRLK